MQKIRIFYNSWICKYIFPEWVYAFTIGSWIFTEFSKQDTPMSLIAHESVHVEQYRRHGIVKFLWIYFWKERGVPYRQKTFEKEAYNMSGEING